MNKTTTMITIILLLCGITAQGIPLPGTQARCLCPNTSSELINPKLIKSLKYIPKGSHCETLEIIVSMKNGKKLCVSPDADWLKIIIKAKKGANSHKRELKPQWDGLSSKPANLEDDGQ
ncbi:interleukin-8-like [Stegostoma tigrinum]|uniref:interleukin-8-like n=1 Tax=Stegostoma tigrinum TaxID=3053191 RepID=UPI00202B029C|nr:interleukin-8-like [Stegostoma tigrinum]